MIVGISANFLRLKGDVFPKKYYVSVDYIKKLQHLKVQNLSTYILPFGSKSDFISLLEVTDGIILSGGYDIHPSFYGEKPTKYLGETCKKRDRFELSLVEECLKRDIVVFGICRGLQLLNVFFGGTLHQDLAIVGHGNYHTQKQRAKKPTQKVEICKNTFLSTFLPKSILVNSFHHQAIDTLGRGLRVAARHKDLIEAVELEGSSSLVFGVQWHPESLKDSYSNSLFSAFLGECEKRKNKKE